MQFDRAGISAFRATLSASPARQLILVVTVGCYTANRQKYAAVQLPNPGRRPAIALTASCRPDLIEQRHFTIHLRSAVAHLAPGLCDESPHRSIRFELPGELRTTVQ